MVTTRPQNYSKHQQPPPPADCQFSLECLETDFVIDILNSVEASSEDTNPASSGDNADQDGGIDLGDFMGEVGEIQITLLQTSDTEGDNSGEMKIKYF